MQRFLSFARLCLLTLLASYMSIGSLRADSATFNISDLTFYGSAASNNLPYPVQISEPGLDGQFLWNYTPEDFQNGTGTLLSITLPITSFPLSEATVVIDNNGVGATNPGNIDNLSHDWMISYAQPITSPTSVTTVLPSSTFDLTGEYTSFNQEYIGNITGGTISPVPELSPNISITLMFGLTSLNLISRRLRRNS